MLRIEMNVYVLYTGGTIGCVGAPRVPLPGPAFVRAFESLIAPIITSRIPGTTFHYDWFEQTLDSTNMQPSDWVVMARAIVDNYAESDAFLILHGTDTMAWTSSALSFLLPGISKPVFVTGSQLPLFHPQGVTEHGLFYNTDALRNVLGAVEFLTFGIPEVCLYFADTLHRGNRAVKSNASQFAAFTSPNFPPLGTYGVMPRLNDRLILPGPGPRALDGDLAAIADHLRVIQENIDASAVLQLMIFPAYYHAASGASLLVSMLTQIQEVSPPLRGVVFESFGEGNIPDFPEMQAVLQRMSARGIVMVDCTQVYSGDVNYDAYATGAWLPRTGVLSGHDMTPIAAFTKLVITLAHDPEAPSSAVRAVMETDQAGEMSRLG